MAAMISHFRNQKKIHRKYAFQIILAVRRMMLETASLVDITIPDGAVLTVCGDIHGQFYDLLNILENVSTLPSPKHLYLFNGDFVDRGSFSLEVVLTLFGYKWLYPDAFFLARGNHETDNMNKVYGFEGEVKSKFSESMFKVFSETFAVLPLAHLVQNKILCVHGGLFSRDDVTLDEIKKIDRFSRSAAQPGTDGLMVELLWSDPQEAMGRGTSKRGVGVQFGPDVTDKFLKLNNLGEYGMPLYPPSTLLNAILTCAIDYNPRQADSFSRGEESGLRGRARRQVYNGILSTQLLVCFRPSCLLVIFVYMSKAV